MTTKQEIRAEIDQLKWDMEDFENEAKRSRGVLQDVVTMVMPYHLRTIKILESIHDSIPDDDGTNSRV